MYAAAKVRQKGDNADERATGIQTLPLTLRGGYKGKFCDAKIFVECILTSSRNTPSIPRRYWCRLSGACRN